MNQFVRSALTLLLLLFLVPSSFQQRGRMPSQGRRPPHPSQGSSGMRPDIDSSQSNQCKIVNGVNTCQQSTNSGGFKINYFVLSGGLVIAGFIYMKKRQIWILKDIYKKEMSTFEQKILAIPCKIKEAELTKKIQAFQNTTFKMDDIRKDKFQHYKCDMRIVNLEKVKDRIYEIKYECKDINGESHLQGLIGIISQNQFGLKLVKVYRKFT